MVNIEAHYSSMITISFWNFCAAGNYAGRFYKFAMKDVDALQEKLMMDSMAMLQSVEAKVLLILNGDATATAAAHIDVVNAASATRGGVVPTDITTSSVPSLLVSALLTVVTNQQAFAIVESWRDLLPQLITK